MIKLHSAGTAPDYTEHGSVSTDCRTVGEFMTEAAEIYGGKLTIKVYGCRYEIFDNSKFRVTDDTPIDEVTYTSTPCHMAFIVTTKPKPKTVKKSGWVNLFRVRNLKPFPVGFVYDDKKDCESDEVYTHCKDLFFATAKIEWEEVQK